VTSAYGVEGFTPALREAFLAHGIEKVLIAYDADDAGNKAAEKLAPELAAMGMAVFRLQFPKGMDANEYVQRVKPAEKSLDTVLRGARWMTGTRSVSVPNKVEETEEASELEVPTDTPLAADVDNDVVSEDDALPTQPHTPASPSLDVEAGEDQTTFRFGERMWRVRGLSKNLSHAQLKVNLLVGCGPAFFVDQLELNSARQRALFLAQAAKELDLEERVLKHDLGRVFMKLEELQDAAIQKALEPKTMSVPEMSEGERHEALALLRDPKLLDRILSDFDHAGVVGEETNKLVGYLAAVLAAARKRGNLAESAGSFPLAT
jgi:DNA primase